MWRAETEDIDSGRKYRLLENQAPLSFRNFIRSLDRDDAFCSWYSQLLADSGYEAFYWEHPPLTRNGLRRHAEFVLIDAPPLAAVKADPVPFQARFDDRSGTDVIAFPNLGGDAMLVVPRPVTAHDAYAHLAAFLRQAPAAQVRSLWRRTAQAVCQELTSTPRWLSTAGLGVAWLHIRIDARPKYYNHKPYKHFPSA